MSLAIYLNESLVDILPNTVVAKTLQCFDLFGLGNVQANYTNQFKLPRTNTNRIIFESADNLKSPTTIPYGHLTAKVIQNGLELISNGYAIVTSTDQYYNVSIFDGNYNFFKLIAGYDCSYIDLSSLNTNWANANIAADQNTSTGIVHAILDCDSINFTGGQYIIKTANAYPSIYFITLIQKAFSTYGFTLSGDILTDPRFARMILPLQMLYNQRLLNSLEFNSSCDGTQSFTATPTPTVVIFNDTALSSSAYNNAGTWTMPIANFGANRVNFSTTLGITVTGGTVNIVLNSKTSATQAAAGSGTYTLFNTANLDSDIPDYYIAADPVTVTIVKNSGTPVVTITSGTFYNKCPIPSDRSNWVPSHGITPQYLLPDVTITDLIKEWALQFGLLFNQKNGIVYAKNIDDLINDTGNAVDWTSKRDSSQQDKLVYQFGNLSQTNIFNWNNSADDSINELFCNGSFTIANINLILKKTTQSLFSSSKQMLYAIPGSAIIMDLVKTGIKDLVTGFPDGAYIKDIGSRLMMVRGNYVTPRDPAPNQIWIDGTTQLSGGVSANQYKIGYFLNGSEPYQMKWQEFLDVYYSQFIIRMQTAKMITRSYLLTDLDILNFDPLKLIYDDGAYFIVNRLIEYVPGRLTKVELLKI